MLATDSDTAVHYAEHTLAGICKADSEETVESSLLISRSLCPTENNGIFSRISILL